MSRTALLGTFVFIVAGLSGCATPAHLVRVDRDAGQVVVAVPEATNSWPYYYEDEAIKTASQYIAEPVRVKSDRVKVGEQMTTVQDSSRRDIGGQEKKVGEVTSSTNTTSVSDKYEHHIVFESASKGAGNFLKKRDLPPAPIPSGTPLNQDTGIKPVGNIEPRAGAVPAIDIREPSAAPPTNMNNSLTLPATPLGSGGFPNGR